MANRDEPRRREGMREYRAEDEADKAQAAAITAYFGSPTMTVQDEPRTAEAIVDHARLTAQGGGKPQIKEMIQVIDEDIAIRCSSARVWMREHGEVGFDWDTWGRKTYVWEAVLSFLQRIDSDPEARDYLVKRFRREVIRDGGKIPVDNSGDPPAA